MENTFKYFPFIKSHQPVIVLAVIGIAFYSTSINNEYALDDNITIHLNPHVIKGVKGIKDIMLNEHYSWLHRGCGIR